MALHINFYEEWNTMSSDQLFQGNSFNLLLASKLKALSEPLLIASQSCNPFRT
jgi:hypothetical protein